MNEEKFQTAMDTLSHIQNTKEFAAHVARYQHRTFQQDFTRLCVEWLRVCASEEYRYDGRNEASHELAKVAVAAIDAVNDGRGLGLPRI